MGAMTALCLLALLAAVPAPASPSPRTAGLAGLALKCAGAEFPNKADHVAAGMHDLARPRDAHPSFYGCFDWHSSVHGHWLMVRALRTEAALPDAARLRAALDAHLSSAAVRGELAYLAQPGRKTFERTYGWAWLLKLAEELRSWDDPDAKRWSSNLEPLAAAFVARYEDFLPKLTYPIRVGTHPNTAFGLAFALDYARAAGDKELEALLVGRAKAYFAADKDYPAAWEPGGEDFFSPALLEADLMRRVLSREEFSRWLTAFLPELGRGGPRSLMTPAIVTDRADPKIVHLDGLNLSRAWCLKGVAAALPPADPRRTVILAAAGRHLDASLPHVASGDYAGEHWLASFALYALSVD
ncbi:MAG: DUF2891 domain-containing protein [Elusimicrobia bacterium]|nr:DUF2891 domain-containing protein [Elusimicrobiota bacterium]